MIVIFPMEDYEQKKHRTAIEGFSTTVMEPNEMTPPLTRLYPVVLGSNLHESC